VENRPASWPDISNTQWDGTGWVDAYLRYGLSLEKGARGKLMKFAPKKKPSGSSDPQLSGVAYSRATMGKTDQHEFSFDVHIAAASQEAFNQKYDLFEAEILDGQYFQLRLACKSGRVRHLLYDSCDQFTESSLEMAKYTLSVTEPHPEITDEREPAILTANT
jgi:hypothetical protein